MPRLGLRRVQELWDRTEGLPVINSVETSIIYSNITEKIQVNTLSGQSEEENTPQKPKSPVWTIAFTLASAARRLS